MTLRPPFTYFGGKTTIAPQIAALLPAHEHYVEPFAGSLAVLLAKRPSRMETVNDPAELERACFLTPHGRAEHQAAFEPAEAPRCCGATGRSCRRLCSMRR